MMLFFTFSNFALEIVDASPRPQLGLGSAAISSITEALSPILPFTGGVDLRREEHWNKTHSGIFDRATYMVDQIRDAFGLDPIKLHPWSSIPRGDTDLTKTSGGATKVHVAPKKRINNHVATLSATQPFVSVDAIASMTLGDLTAAFQFAVQAHRPGFNEKRFLETIHSRMRPIVASLKNAVAKSRGDDVEPAATLEIGTGAYGDVDALQFCGAMRLFAEWRVVRQVPEGYKGFAVGMNLGHKDIAQNVAKIEKAVHEWIEHRRDLLSLLSQWDSSDPEACAVDSEGTMDCTLRSPTLRQLLEHERDMNVHDNSRLPRLKDRTGAMGLLWVRRQLQYQTSLFANLLQVPKGFSTTNAAISAAYNDVYGKYHGWAVQKIFNYSFQTAPDVDLIYEFMNPHHLKLVKKKARQLAPSSLVDSDDNTGEDVVLNPLQLLGKRIMEEWENLVGIFGEKSENAAVAGSSPREADDEVVHDFVVKQMTANAHDNIEQYLQVVQPLLGDLEGLFDDLNMDDPTKV
jgi:hypothetical protein